MADASFLARWSRRKAAARAHGGSAPATDAPRAEVGIEPPAAIPPAAAPPPSMDDAARARHADDFSRFLARGVDADVRRTALRALFTDPHFNIMDGLDVYIGDYTQASPMPPAMLAALAHAQAILATTDHTEQTDDADRSDER